MILFALGRGMAEQKRGEHSLAREQRKLAAILAADAVGYSRLMGVTRAERLRGSARPLSSESTSSKIAQMRHADRVRKCLLL
jgi:class 3 adenylate cyclase